MLVSIPDKKAIWGQVLAELDEQIDAGLSFMLRSKAHLDRCERGQATIVVQTVSLERALYRGGLLKKLENALTGLMSHSVKVSIVLGRSRAIDKATEKWAPNTQQVADLADQIKRSDLMTVIDTHPVFAKVLAPVPQGGWGLFPALLTQACQDYGLEAVLAGIRYTAARPKVRNPRAFFLSGLERGEFGERNANH